MRHLSPLPLAGLLGLLLGCQGAKTPLHKPSTQKARSQKALPSEPIVFVGIIGGIT